MPARRNPKPIPVWLVPVPIVTLGMMSALPFLVAAVRLRVRSLWLVTAGYAALTAAGMTLAIAFGDNSRPADVGGLLLLAAMVAGASHAWVVREVYPRARVDDPKAAPVAFLPPGVGGSTLNTPGQLAAALAALRARCAQHAAAFGPSCRTLLENTFARTDQVISFVAQGGRADDGLRIVQSVLTDYLPTSLDTYLRLPQAYATSHRNPDGRTAVEELETQLRLLATSVHEAADSLYRDDALRLQTQSSFLQAKFGKSELDLP